MSTTTPITPVLDQQTTARHKQALRAAAWSETGTRHPDNEDSWRIVAPQGSPVFCGVADGVGGGSRGDVASAALMDYCSRFDDIRLADNHSLAEWFKASDSVVREQLQRYSDKPGAATMVGAWWLGKQQWRVIHVGDCRAYVFSRNQQGWQLQQLTQDQNYQRLGLSPPGGGSPDDPARMVGVNVMGNPEITELNLPPAHYLLLCSDGLHKFVDEEVLLELVSQGVENRIDETITCRLLVNAAKQAGSHDDVTALLIAHDPAPVKTRWLLYGLVFMLILSLLLVI